jgi:hypothetical protein
LEGNLRGLVAEKVSELVGINEAKNVFVSGDFSIEDCSIISPQELVGSPKDTKASVISTSLIKGLQDKPIEIFGEPLSISEKIAQFKESRKGKSYVPKEVYNKLLKSFLEDLDEKSGGTNQEIETDLRKDFELVPRGSPPEYSTLTSETYYSTVIPDALIVKADSSKTGWDVVGVGEVKAYLADEVYTLMNKIRESGKLGTQYEGVASDFGKTYEGADKDRFTMGVDLNKETEFADFVRGVFLGKPNNYEENIILLRFPNDIPDNLLKQFGQMVVDYGYPKVVIQKIPVSIQEINVISKEIINAAYPDICFQLLNRYNFSDKEISVLDRFRNS